MSPEDEKLLEEALLALRPFADYWDAEKDMFRIGATKPTPGFYKRAYNAAMKIAKRIDDTMECGHSVKYIVYASNRNYCAICGADARQRNTALMLKLHRK